MSTNGFQFQAGALTRYARLGHGIFLRLLHSKVLKALFKYVLFTVKELI